MLGADRAAVCWVLWQHLWCCDIQKWQLCSNPAGGAQNHLPWALRLRVLHPAPGVCSDGGLKTFSLTSWGQGHAEKQQDLAPQEDLELA